jgi:hypothetical protein
VSEPPVCLEDVDDTGRDDLQRVAIAPARLALVKGVYSAVSTVDGLHWLNASARPIR